MLSLPPDTPVTFPLLSTVAICLLIDDHAVGLSGVADPVKGVILPLHTFKVPPIVGGALTVTFRVVSPLVQVALLSVI